jgi:hypothetical protein
VQRRRSTSFSQTIDQYKKEIEELKERINPTTPPEVENRGNKKLHSK